MDFQGMRCISPEKRWISDRGVGFLGEGVDFPVEAEDCSGGGCRLRREKNRTFKRSPREWKICNFVPRKGIMKILFSGKPSFGIRVTKTITISIE